MRSLRLIPLVLVALLAATQTAAAATPPRARIIGGTPAGSGEYPAQTSVRFTVPSGSYACGGTLVAGRWVLTAAHCATGDNGAALLPGNYNNMRVGSTSRLTGGTPVTVDQVHRHEGFFYHGNPDTTPPNFDLALLRLAAAPPEEPIRLIGPGASDAAFWSPGTPATIIGWGATDNNEPDPTTSPLQLLEAQVPIVSDEACAAAWPDRAPSFGFNPASMVCAGGTSTDSCIGDSGGPLMVPRAGTLVIAGVTSWGAGRCGTPGVPGVYVRLAEPSINAWVRQRIPTIGFTTSPAQPIVGEPVTLIASTTAGGTPTVSWDTDGDGSFDATGPSVTRTFPTIGPHQIALRASYPDGDRTAIVRDAVSVGAPPPPPPPPPPPASAPAGAGSQTPTPRQLTNGVTRVTRRMQLATLRTRGVRVRFECERACTLRGRLTIGPLTARRFGLGNGRRSVTIGSAARRLTAAGSGTLTVKLTRRAKLKLRNRPRATISVITTLTAGDTKLSRKQTVAVRR